MGTTSEPKNLQSLIFERTSDGCKLSVLDQLLVPQEKKYIDIPNVEAAWGVIRSMQIRGAPLIAIVAVLGLAVDLSSSMDQWKKDTSTDALLETIAKKVEYLKTSRPTAVNVFHALAELTTAATAAAADGSTDAIVQVVMDHAEFMLRRDVSDNEKIGHYGAEELVQKTGKDKDIRMMTICNTGSLATAGYGTALGVVRALHHRQQLQSIVALETRPYNQGSRLTSFEIVEEELAGGKLICDSAAAAYMNTKGIDAVVVGADRVCANGDTANKIGTYQLSIIANAHNVPFYVASPFTTLDASLPCGEHIPVEERPAAEFLETSRAPSTIPVWNPGFDVTPSRLIQGIITEKGVIPKQPDGTFDIPSFM